MDILDDMGVSKLSAYAFLKKVNYSFNPWHHIIYAYPVFAGSTCLVDPGTTFLSENVMITTSVCYSLYP